ncbi:MAG: hypothetical protein AAGF12_10040 [Myxococcota bacterium]
MKYFALLVVLAGCGGATVVSDPTPNHERPTSEPSRVDGEPEHATNDANLSTTPETAPEDRFLRARGRGETAEAAYEDGRARLIDQILGEGWSSLLSVSVHDRSEDYYAETESESVVEVVVGLSRERLAAVLTALGTAEPELPASLPWRDRIEPVTRAHLARQVCVQRRELLAEECELPDTSDADASARALAESLRLVPVPAGGVPLGDDGVPLRPPTVLLVEEDRPAPEVVLTAELAASADAPELSPVPTSAEGAARFALPDGARWSGPIRVRLDAADLLGPVHTVFPAVEVVLEGREVGLNRWAAVVTEHVRGSRASDRIFAQALEATLRERGARAPANVSTNDSRRILRLNGTRRAQKIASVADELAGAMDMLLVVEIDSEFASRMGTTRVWYEARGEVVVHNAWTGEVVTTIQASERATGPGDQPADHAARRRLARTLVERLVSDPALRFVSEPSS